MFLLVRDDGLLKVHLGSPQVLRPEMNLFLSSGFHEGSGLIDSVVQSLDSPSLCWSDSQSEGSDPRGWVSTCRLPSSPPRTPQSRRVSW